MSLTDELCASFRDLEAHYDPAPEGRLGRFDEAAVREHLAAFRAIEAGIEELAVEDAADEIDRTALLDDIRVTIFRLQHQQPQVHNPALWLGCLSQALEAGGRADGPTGGSTLELLKSVPGFLLAAEDTLREPPSIFVDAARALVRPAADLIAGLVHGGQPGGPVAAAAAAAQAALERFMRQLEGPLSAHGGEHAAGVGADEFDRILHFRYAIRAGAGETWRYVMGLREELEQELPPLDREDVATPNADPRELIAGLREPARAAGFPVPEVLPELGALPDHAAVLGPVSMYVRARGMHPARFLSAGGGWSRVLLPALLVEGVLPGTHALASHAGGLSSRVRQTATVNDGGFGLYALELLDRAGHVAGGQLLLYRTILAQIDIGLHTAQLGLGDALQLLADRFPFEPAQAMAAVRGVLMEPGLATGAIAGRRELLKLRDDARTTAGGAFSDERFHAELMSYGSLPVSLIRWGMGAGE